MLQEAPRDPAGHSLSTNCFLSAPRHKQTIQVLQKDGHPSHYFCSTKYETQRTHTNSQAVGEHRLLNTANIHSSQVRCSLGFSLMLQSEWSLLGKMSLPRGYRPMSLGPQNATVMS